MSDNNLRNLEIVEKLFREDISFQDVANDYSLTKERVRYIFISVFRSLQSPNLLDAGIQLPDDDCFDLNVIRKDSKLWLEQLEKLKNVERVETNDPLTAHLNIPVRLTKDLFFVNNYQALKRAFVAYNNNKQPEAFENFKMPEYFPCFVMMSYFDDNQESLKFHTLTLPVVESMMQHQHFH